MFVVLVVEGEASSCRIISPHCPQRRISCLNSNKRSKTLCHWVMTPGFHTSSEFIELEFIENEGSAFIFKGGDIYPATTFSREGFISVTASDGWRCNHPVSLLLLGRSTMAGCWGSVVSDCCTATVQLIREQPPGINTASWSCGFMNELLDAVLPCISPCVVIYCCANKMKSDPSDPVVTCC